METNFSIGDLVRFKPTEYSNKVFQDLADAKSLVLVTDTLKSEAGKSKTFFYGMLLSSGITHLWNVSEFYLVSNKDGEKNLAKNFDLTNSR